MSSDDEQLDYGPEEPSEAGEQGSEQAAADEAEADAAGEAGEDLAEAEQAESGERYAVAAPPVQLVQMSYEGDKKASWGRGDSIDELEGLRVNLDSTLGSLQQGGQQVKGGLLQATWDTMRSVRQLVALPEGRMDRGFGLLLRQNAGAPLYPAAGQQWCLCHGTNTSHDSKGCRVLKWRPNETTWQLYSSRVLPQLLAQPDSVNRQWVQKQLRQQAGEQYRQPENGAQHAAGRGCGRPYGQQRESRGWDEPHCQQQGGGDGDGGADPGLSWAARAIAAAGGQRGNGARDGPHQRRAYDAVQHEPGYGAEWGPAAAAGYEYEGYGAAAAGWEHEGCGAKRGFGHEGQAAGYRGGASVAYAQRWQAAAADGGPQWNSSAAAAAATGASREPPHGWAAAAARAGPGPDGVQSADPTAAAQSGMDSSVNALFLQSLGLMIDRAQKHSAQQAMECGMEKQKSTDRKRKIEVLHSEVAQGSRERTELELRQQRWEAERARMQAELDELRYRKWMYEGDF